MNTTWKIFKVLNFVEIILLVSLFSLMIWKGNLSIDKNTYDLIGVIFFLLTVIVISANCINNTKMLKLWIDGQHFNLWNKVFFWIGIIFLLGLSGLVIWGNVEMYHSFHRENFKGRLQTGEIIALAWIDTIILLSLLIAALQSILFTKGKNTFKLNQDLIIEAIGKEV